MVVARVIAGRMVEIRRCISAHRKPPCHAEMHDKNFTRRQVQRQEFCPPPHALNARAADAFGKAFGKGEAQIGPILKQ